MYPHAGTNEMSKYTPRHAKHNVAYIYLTKLSY